MEISTVTTQDADAGDGPYLLGGVDKEEETGLG